MVNDQDLFNELCSDPIEFYVLYRISINPFQVELPCFMDYGSICWKLEEKSLVQTNSKHIHDKKYNLTTNMNRWIVKHKEEMDNLFIDIDLSSNEKFLNMFYERRSKSEKSKIAESIWPILQDNMGLPELNKPIKYRNLILKLTEVKIKNNSPSIYDVSITLNFICLECKNENNVDINVRYNLDEYLAIPDAIKFKCQNCGAIFESDSYFSRIRKY